MKYIDMHADTVSALMNRNTNLNDPTLMVNLPLLKNNDCFIQCFAMFVHLDKHNDPFEYCDKMIDRYYQLLSESQDDIKPIFTYQDIETNFQNNILSALLTIEEGAVCQGDLDKLEYFYKRGVRMMTITWNFKNELASPNINYYQHVHYQQFGFEEAFNNKEGLTPIGIQFIKKMNELGMVIDCSHASDATFYDCIKYSTKPIICSHSNCRAICHFPRNISDDMLYKLKENGGVIGVTICHDFVVESSSKATIKDLIKHINHIVKTIGIDYVGIGCDFDGTDNTNIEMKDASFIPKLIIELQKEGYCETDIAKITHLNVLRVLKANLKQA